VHEPGQRGVQAHPALGADDGSDHRIAAPAGLQKFIPRQPPRQQLALLRRQLVVEHCRQLTVEFLVHPNSSARPSPPSNTSRRRRSIASRARKILERTVPTGQSMAAAISSYDSHSSSRSTIAVRRSSGSASMAALTIERISSVSTRASGVSESFRRLCMSYDSSLLRSMLYSIGLRSRDTTAFLAVLIAIRYNQV